MSFFMAMHSASFAQISESFESTSVTIAQDWKYTGFNKSFSFAKSGSKSVASPTNINIAYIESDTFVITATGNVVINARLQSMATTSNSNVLVTIREVFTNVTSNISTPVSSTMWSPVSGIMITTPGVYVARFQFDVEISNNGFLDDFSVTNASWYNTTLGIDESNSLHSGTILKPSLNSTLKVHPNVWSTTETTEIRIGFPAKLKAEDDLTIYVISTTGIKYTMPIAESSQSADELFISSALLSEFPVGVHYLILETREEKLCSKICIRP